MAGSFVYQDSDFQASLSARLEGLKVLADHVDEPVVIFNPQMELVYANPTAERLGDSCPLLPSSGGVHAPAHLHRMTHCEPCPGKHLFAEIDPCADTLPALPSSPAISNPACPLPRAVPLRGEEGIVHFAVLMGPRGRESVVLGSPEMGQLVIPPAECRQTDRDSRKAIIGESVPIQRLVEMIQ
ncbi:MAG: hypothetical protein CO149_06470, partial [Nitrospirae bacterium CG_4_9_14_3_um_filter_51_5]